MLYLFYYKNLHLPFDYYPWINTYMIAHFLLFFHKYFNINKEWWSWEDEYHYIFECTEFINERKLDFDFVHINRHNIFEYNKLMSSKSIYTLSNLCKFIRIVSKRTCPLG